MCHSGLVWAVRVGMSLLVRVTEAIIKHCGVAREGPHQVWGGKKGFLEEEGLGGGRELAGGVVRVVQSEEVGLSRQTSCGQERVGHIPWAGRGWCGWRTDAEKEQFGWVGKGWALGL